MRVPPAREFYNYHIREVIEGGLMWNTLPDTDGINNMINAKY